MKKIFLLIGLCMLAGAANAQWVKVADASSNTPTYYVNKSLIQRSGSKVKIWELKDYANPVVIEKNPFLSAKILNEYDCSKNMYSTLSMSFFKENMGNGAIIYSEDPPPKPMHIQPDSVGEMLYKFACNKR